MWDKDIKEKKEGTAPKKKKDETKKVTNKQISNNEKDTAQKESTVTDETKNLMSSRSLHEHISNAGQKWSYDGKKKKKTQHEKTYNHKQG